MTALRPLRRLFTAAEYHLMAQAGILHEDDRVELIDGEIVEMAPIGSRHAAHVNRLNRVFTQALGEGVIVSVQNPISLGERCEPQPDLTLLRPRPDFYAQAHPGPADILLVVEVADSSLGYDRGVKVPLYARFGIPETWVMDLAAAGIQVYRHPHQGRYLEARHAARGEHISPRAIPEVTLAVAELLAPPD